MWAPWALHEAESIIVSAIAKPIKWKADRLGWLLHLADNERTLLNITTIGAFDVGRPERLERRKAKRRAADRARRAKLSSGRPRGRPKLNARPAVDYLLVGGLAFFAAVLRARFSTLNVAAPFGRAPKRLHERLENNREGAS
jgi:hypothetical protein